MRRLILPRVQAISSVADYVLLGCVMAPFLTGFCAYHQWFDYKTVITLHLLAGNLMLIVLPFTKIGHMVFFFFVRLCISSEFGPSRGSREWKAVGWTREARPRANNATTLDHHMIIHEPSMQEHAAAAQKTNVAEPDRLRRVQPVR